MKKLGKQRNPSIPLPNCEGSYFPLHQILAKELNAMSEDLKKQMTTMDIPHDTTLEVIAKICQDGLGDVTGVKTFKPFKSMI